MHLVDGRRYACWGLFNDWSVERSDFVRRTVLEIHRVDEAASEPLADAALDVRPDAVVVMMNPGSSAPRPGFGSQEFDGRLVPAKPDAVQYQVMRLMGASDWRHVRVVNLADIRAAKSADLYALIESGASPAALGALFSSAACIDPGRIVNTSPVICAWGMDRRLAALAREAHAWIGARQLTALGWRAEPSGAEFPAYRYPKPVGNWKLAVEWLERVREQVAVSA